MATPQAISLALGRCWSCVLSYRQIFVIMGVVTALAAAYIAVAAAPPDRRRRTPAARPGTPDVTSMERRSSTAREHLVVTRRWQTIRPVVGGSP